MPDPRFFEAKQDLSLRELALAAGLAASAGSARARIREAAPLSAAGPRSVSFLEDGAHREALAKSKAAAVFIREKHAALAPAGCVALICSHPHAAWALAADRLHRPLEEEGDLAVHQSVVLEDGVTLAPQVVIGANARIGRGTRIGAGSVIGPGVAIGRDCAIGPNVSVRFALLGDRVTLLAGVRIGEAGFAVATGPKGPVDVPQLGRAILQDGVTVGANSCIDRGGYDDTVIGENTKIDNLVHVGHNVRIGRDCRLAAFTGLSGSVAVGDGVLFGGKAGVADWVSIGEGAAIGASASVFKDVPAGETWTGFPARPMRRWLREQAMLAKLARPGRGAKNEED